MRSSLHPIEFLHSYADLVAWGEHVWILSEAQAAALAEQAAQMPDTAATIFKEAIDLRESLHRIFRAVVRGEHWRRQDEERLKRAYIVALSHAELHPTEMSYGWQWPRQEELAIMLWPVVQAAVELLCSQVLGRVKECPGANDCGWLFLDTSKNGTRRWCSMEGCGSRVKMRRSYARKRAADSTGHFTDI